MNEFERREMMFKLVDGTYTPGELASWRKQAESSEDYGDLSHIAKDSEGKRIETEFHGEKRTYFVPSDQIWINGAGIRLDLAYRVFKEDEKGLEVREVLSGSERNAIIQWWHGEIDRVLAQCKARREKK